MNSVRNTSTTFKITPAEIKLEKVGNLNHPNIRTVNSRYNEVLFTCLEISDIRYKRLIINSFSALGGKLHFVISSYFVISDLVIAEVYCTVRIFIDIPDTGTSSSYNNRPRKRIQK